ncbi:hypothetical protein HK405_005250, partial [Cladochytrium tenue]
MASSEPSPPAPTPPAPALATSATTASAPTLANDSGAVASHAADSTAESSASAPSLAPSPAVIPRRRSFNFSRRKPGASPAAVTSDSSDAASILSSTDLHSDAASLSPSGAPTSLGSASSSRRDSHSKEPLPLTPTLLPAAVDDWRRLFPSVPADDVLYEAANDIGVLVSLDSIVDIQKKNIAVLISKAIEVEDDTGAHLVFSGFFDRELAFDVVYRGLLSRMPSKRRNPSGLTAANTTATPDVAPAGTAPRMRPPSVASLPIDRAPSITVVDVDNDDALSTTIYDADEDSPPTAVADPHTADRRATVSPPNSLSRPAPRLDRRPSFSSLRRPSKATVTTSSAAAASSAATAATVVSAESVASGPSTAASRRESIRRSLVAAAASVGIAPDSLAAFTRERGLAVDLEDIDDAADPAAARSASPPFRVFDPSNPSALSNPGYPASFADFSDPFGPGISSAPSSPSLVDANAPDHVALVPTSGSPDPAVMNASCDCEPTTDGLVPYHDRIYPMSLVRLKDRLYSRGWAIEGGSFFVNYNVLFRKVKDLRVSPWCPPEKEAMPLAPATDIVASELLDLDVAVPGWHRSIEYSQPVIAGKFVRCVVREELVRVTKNQHVCVKSTVRNPNLPSNFQYDLQTCLTACGKDAARMRVSAAPTFDRFSLINVPINIGANEGLRNSLALQEQALLQSASAAAQNSLFTG